MQLPGAIMLTAEVELPVGLSIKVTIQFPLGSGSPEITLDPDPEHALWG